MPNSSLDPPDFIRESLKRQPRIALRLLLVALILSPVVLTLGVFVVHGAFNLCDNRALGAEARGWTSRWSWLPPGVECTYVHEDGVERTDLIPWTG